jgi:hypothetical protein
MDETLHSVDSDPAAEPVRTSVRVVPDRAREEYRKRQRAGDTVVGLRRIPITSSICEWRMKSAFWPSQQGEERDRDGEEEEEFEGKGGDVRGDGRGSHAPEAVEGEEEGNDEDGDFEDEVLADVEVRERIPGASYRIDGERRRRKTGTRCDVGRGATAGMGGSSRSRGGAGGSRERGRVGGGRGSLPPVSSRVVVVMRVPLESVEKSGRP